MNRSTNVFAPVFLAMCLTACAASVAIISWHAADRYLPELNIKKPELSKHEPFLGYAPPRSTRRVVLVIVDGLRLRDSFGRATIGNLRRAGVDAIATSHYPTISRPNHATLVTGVPPLASGVRNNHVRTPVLIDSLMDRVRAGGLSSACVADDSPSLGYLFGNDFQALYYGRWPGAFTKSTRLALAEERNSLLVLIPGGVDLAGHEFGGDSPEYRAAVDQVDAELAEALDLVDLTKDTVIFTADHGHTDAGGHGGEEPDVLEVPLIIAGAGIRSHALLGSAELMDVAPTVAALLGVPAPGHALGRTLTEVLEIGEKETTALKAADARRIQQNSRVYINALDLALEQQSQQRRNRLIWLGMLFVLGLVFFAGARYAGALHIDWRVLLIAVPAYPLCYFGLLDLLGQSLSFSALKDRGSELSHLSRFGLVAVVAQLVAGWIALNGRVVLRDRLAAANALIACGLLVAWLPAGLLWAYHAPPHVDIPGSRIALLIPANYIAVATYALGATVLLGLEIVIFFARAVDPRVRLRRLERAAARQRRQMEQES